MKKFISLVAAILFAATTFAQVDEVTLTVLGTGCTEEEATNIALRSAVEQSFGAFVSANTTILNDRLVKDEIVSLSKGNIKNYDKLSVSSLPNGQVGVSIKATVSIKKLTTFAKSHGSSCELAGNTFAQNMKLRELNKKNEEIAAQHLAQQLRILEEDLFDVSIDAGQPYKARNGNGYNVPITFVIRGSKNTEAYIDLFFSTLRNLRLSDEEKKSYQETKDKFYERKIWKTYEHPNMFGNTVEDSKEVYLGAFRASGTIPVLKMYRQLENMKICYRNDHRKYKQIDLQSIVAALYRTAFFGNGAYVDLRHLPSTLKDIEKFERASKDNYNHLQMNYFNLDAYRLGYQVKEGAFGKVKKTPNKEYPIIATFTWDYFVPEEDMSSLTGFDIVKY